MGVKVVQAGKGWYKCSRQGAARMGSPHGGAAWRPAASGGGLMQRGQAALNCGENWPHQRLRFKQACRRLAEHCRRRGRIGVASQCRRGPGTYLMAAIFAVN